VRSYPGRARWTEPALAWLSTFIERRATPAQVLLLQLAVEEGHAQAIDLPNGLPAAELPLLVFTAANTTSSAPQLALAGCCLSIYLGADIFDNVADDELPDRWAPHGPALASLTGVTLLAPFAALALAELQTSSATRLLLHEALAEALAAMSAGQTSDLSMVSREDVSLDAAEQVAVAKTGEELAFFSRAGALLAECPPDVCDAYAMLGRHLGASRQIASDCIDLFAGRDAYSHDLASGKRTLPIVYALATLPARQRATLLGHLQAAPSDDDRAETARGILRTSGAIEFGALAAEIQRRRALAALRVADPCGPGAEALEQYVNDSALFS
jgi:octaprenyl-diphosphate synthase